MKSNTFLLSFIVLSILSIIPLAIFAQEGDEKENAYSRISEKLDSSTAVLVFDLSRMEVDVIKSKGTITRKLPDSEEPLEIKVSMFKSIIETRDPSEPFQNDAHALYNLLIKPVSGELSGITRLGIIPAPELHDLSFAALVSERDTKNAFMPRPRFLLDDYAIFYAPSLTSMGEALSWDKSTNIGGIVIGSAKYPGGYGEIKVAPIEMKSVSGLVPGTSMFEKDRASESVFKDEITKGAFSLLHITTHSKIRVGNDSGSALIFCGGDEEDGNLTVDEVKGMEIDIDLVTISADEAGLTWGESGGFPHAFLGSGAASVLAPVWTIDRGVTSLLMEFFYEKLKEHDKAEALRLAQKMVIDAEKDKGYRRLAHPGFWAPFVLYGSYK